MPVKRIPYQIAAAGLSAGGLLSAWRNINGSICGIFCRLCCVSWSLLFAGKHGVSKILVHFQADHYCLYGFGSNADSALGELRMEGIVTGGIMLLVPDLHL